MTTSRQVRDKALRRMGIEPLSRSNIITQLHQLGCGTVSYETSEGAMKWWLTYPKPLTKSLAENRDMVRELIGDMNALRYPESEYQGDGFVLSWQRMSEDGFDGIFVAKPKDSNAGRLYRLGVDV